MLPGIVIALTLTCGAPRITGGKPDPAVLERAVEVCAVQYRGCLVELRKTGDYSYKAICRRHRRGD